MTRLLNKFIIDKSFYRLTAWAIDRAKHFSEIMYLCYLLRGRKDIFCCSQNSLYSCRFAYTCACLRTCGYFASPFNEKLFIGTLAPGVHHQ